jgi:hypothetical protein
VIFVAVRKNDAAYALAIFGEIRNIGDNDVYAQQFRFGEHQTRVDDDNVITPPDGHAVHTELAQPPEGDNLQFSSWHR